jgi:hypothetical protein
MRRGCVRLFSLGVGGSRKFHERFQSRCDQSNINQTSAIDATNADFRHGVVVDASEVPKERSPFPRDL